MLLYFTIVVQRTNTSELRQWDAVVFVEVRRVEQEVLERDHGSEVQAHVTPYVYSIQRESIQPRIKRRVVIKIAVTSELIDGTYRLNLLSL